MDLKTVLQTDYVAALARKVCGEEPVVVRRPTTNVVKREEETDRQVDRLIVLPPKGHTANRINQTNSYAEVERATIQVHGAVRSGKRGFSKVKDCLLRVSFNEASLVSRLEKPYIEFDLDDPNPSFEKMIHSSGEAPFHVVKPDGMGVYHSLINLKDEWLVLELHKVLRPRREPVLEPFLHGMPRKQADLLREVHAGIVEFGDELFAQRPDLIEAVMALPPATTLPALGELLHVRDTGRHEACTAFALILRMGKTHRLPTTEYLWKAREAEAIPAYYADQLLAKIARHFEGGSPGRQPQ